MKAGVILAGTIFLLLTSCCHSNLSQREETKLLNRVTAAVVIVETDIGMGSGTTVASTRDYSLVLTNFHVVVGAKGVWIKHGDETNPASVEAFDADKDLALLMTGPTGLPALPIAKKEPLEFERIYIVGNPLGMEDTVADGMLTSKYAHPYGMPKTLWRLMGFVVYGSSGGAVVNRNGELIAVPEIVRIYPAPVFMETPDSPPSELPLKSIVPITQVGYAVPLGDIKEFLKVYKF
jgi:S1-C subfamily serine protease